MHGRILPPNSTVTTFGVPEEDSGILLINLPRAAAYRLRYGEAAQATKDLERALALDAGNQDALALLSIIAITRNDLALAGTRVDASLQINTGHYLTQLAASKLAQARFNLEEALEHALEARRLAPDSTEATASASELLYGSGKAGEAAAMVREMLRLHPDDPRLLTVDGFVSLGLNKLDDAHAAFSRSITLDPSRADAHLGLGLVYFNQGKREDGLEELLTASFLAPQVSLYCSYLGKAYHEERRFDESLASLDTAERLDPRDPTPNLYAGIIKRDLYRHREALEELEDAIRKNDNRAVYRSRLLLDQDQAIRNVSLAQLYEEVGFSALGAFHATKSIDLNFSNSSAHLFAAGSLLDLPDRTTAASSEPLIARLLLPVNLNSFNSFNEYTNLLSAPGITGRLRAGAGETDYRQYSGSVNGGNNRFSYFAHLSRTSDAGYLGQNSDLKQTIWNVTGKLGLGTSQSLLFDSLGLRADAGDIGQVAVVVDDNSSMVPIRFIRPEVPDLNARIKAEIIESFVGYHNHSLPNHNVLFVLSSDVDDYRTVNPDEYNDPIYPPIFWDFGRKTFETTRSIGAAGQHQFSVGRHQFLYGFDLFDLRDNTHSTAYAEKGDFAGTEFELDRASGKNHFRSFYGHYLASLPHDSTLTLGLRRDSMDIQDLLLPVAANRVKDTAWRPELGIRLQLAPKVSLRAAAFRSLMTHDKARIAPQLVSGFALQRGESAGTERKEADLGIDLLLPGQSYLGVSAFYRNVDAPVYSLDSNYDLVRSVGAYKVWGVRVDLNQSLGRILNLKAELQARDIHTSSFDQKDLQGVFGLRLIESHGWFLSLTETFLHQRYDLQSPTAVLPDTDVWFTDVSMKKEFSHKRGRIGFNVANLFGQDFNVVVEGLSVTQRLPAREANVFVEWAF